MRGFNVIAGFFVMGVLGTAALSSPVSAAPQHRPVLAQSEQDSAREEMLEGKIKSYSDIVRRARRAVPGRVVGQDLQRAGRDRWVYRIKVLQEGGKVASVTLDAHTGRILSVKGKR
ncbi:hypothetical protein JCM17844_13970 [Iodidimonas gelatinilytica]|uniref:PepSY domain-containing protein n=1 Tax=Iodidimonas gelatinilytica TaxID=1236966 RepID=A0A5A7MZ08_9PROT|nr:PepSY domain-containing protein [Iodidimonas gelatinilytica]GEQ97760.1 hypothetical protein JCM17844_13970 [Iodidimonas gelatinilytica]GER01027.1 hypothetical protein JCM17845_16500 [Iodidimonas gelatinilytica]